MSAGVFAGVFQLRLQQNMPEVRHSGAQLYIRKPLTGSGWAASLVIQLSSQLQVRMISIPPPPLTHLLTCRVPNRFGIFLKWRFQFWRFCHWVVPEKVCTLPMEEIVPLGREGKKNLFLITVSVLRGWGRGGGNFQFPLWGRYSKDVFFGMYHFIQILTKTIV